MTQMIAPYPLPDSVTSLFERPVRSTADQKKEIKEAVRKGFLEEEEGNSFIQVIEGYERSVQED